MKTKVQKKDYLQVRIDRAAKRGADLVAKLEKISQVTGLSLNDVANMSVAAGLAMVEKKLGEIHQPSNFNLQPEKQAA